MPEEAFINKELGIIEIKSYGIVTREDLVQVLQDVDAMAKETGFNKVLVDTTEETELPSILELDDFGAAIPSSLKIALVFTEEQPTKKKMQFIKNVSFTQGTLIEGFTSREAALEWLT